MAKFLLDYTITRFLNTISNPTNYKEKGLFIYTAIYTP